MFDLNRRPVRAAVTAASLASVASVASVVLLSAGAPVLAAGMISGTPGDDELIGTASADTLLAGAGEDRVAGLAGADMLRGGPGADVLSGGRGSDTLNGDDGVDVLRGRRGADTLYAGTTDRAFGGAGDDVIASRSVPAARNVVECGAGTDVVIRADPQDQLGTDCEAAYVVIQGPPGGGARVEGTRFADTVFLRGGGNTVRARSGDDILYLGAGGAPDVVRAGAGDDYVKATNSRRDLLTCGSGRDIVVASSQDQIAADCEKVSVYVPGTPAADTIVGSDFRDVISTVEGDDSIRSRGGRDQVFPGEGEDSVRSGRGKDYVVTAYDGERDVVRCGTGRDTVEAGPTDRVRASCEKVEIIRGPGRVRSLDHVDVRRSSAGDHGALGEAGRGQR